MAFRCCCCCGWVCKCCDWGCSCICDCVSKFVGDGAGRDDRDVVAGTVAASAENVDRDPPVAEAAAYALCVDGCRDDLGDESGRVGSGVVRAGWVGGGEGARSCRLSTSACLACSSAISAAACEPSSDTAHWLGFGAARATELSRASTAVVWPVMRVFALACLAELFASLF